MDLPVWRVYVQSEYVSERDKRRQFISGFTGSAGEYGLKPSALLIFRPSLLPGQFKHG
jgi:hypothetical protein